MSVSQVNDAMRIGYTDINAPMERGIILLVHIGQHYVLHRNVRELLILIFETHEVVAKAHCVVWYCLNFSSLSQAYQK